MQVVERDGEEICIGFEEEYRKYVSGEESKIFREVPGYRGKPTLYSMYYSTGGIFSCDANGVLPPFPKLGEPKERWMEEEREHARREYNIAWNKHFRS